MYLQSNVYIVFRNGNILDLSQPENTIDTGIGIFLPDER